MKNLEDLSEYTKSVVAVIISENVIQKLKKGDGYDCCRSALDLCWKWIERKNIEKIDPWDICFYLQPESDLLCYYIDNENEKEKEMYGTIFATVSYVAMSQFSNEDNGYPPEDLCDIDDEYYQSIISTAIAMEECSYGEAEIDRIIDYCNAKLEENSKYMFCKMEIEKTFLNILCWQPPLPV